MAHPFVPVRTPRVAAADQGRAARPWCPLLVEEEAERAMAAVFAIADDLAETDPGQQPGLGGHSAHAIFFAYLAAATGRVDYAELAVERHERALGEMGASMQRSALYGGYSGIGWMDAHLSGSFFDAEESEEPSLVDHLLMAALQASPWESDYDLILGLVGYGVYSLERQHSADATPLLALVMDRLVERREETPAGTTWHTAAELLQRWATPDTAGSPEYEAGYYNLGVAHGVPGVMGLLACMAQAGLDTYQSRGMLAAAVDWVLEQRLPGDAKSVFPSWVIPGADAPATRTAWCYGDAGVAGVLALAGEATHNTGWTEVAIDVSRRCARRSVKEAGVADAGICHGAAGLAQIFSRIYWRTGDPTCQRAAHTWLKRTLEFREPGRGCGGFRALLPVRDAEGRVIPGRSLEPQADSSFLTGSAGIGLVLLSAAAPVAPDWDRLLLLS